MSTIKYRLYFFTLLFVNFTFGSYFFASYINESIFHTLIFVINFPVLFFILLRSLRFSRLDNVFTIRLVIYFITIALILIGWFFNGAENGIGFFLRATNGFLTFIVVSFLIRNNLHIIDILLKDILTLLLVFLVLECVTRIFFPEKLGIYVSEEKFRQIGNMVSSDEGAFYYLKILSYLRFDSNGVGVIAFLSFCLSIFSQKLKIVNNILSICFFFLICLTLSRAAIAISILFYLFSLNYRYIILALPIIIIGGGAMLPFFIYGGSGESKIAVINNLLLYFEHVDIYQILLGQGIAADIFDSNKTGVEGFFGHNIIVFLIFYVGALSMFLYFIFLYPIKEANKHSCLFLLCLLAIGMSYLRPFESFVFILVPLIYLLANRLNDEEV